MQHTQLYLECASSVCMKARREESSEVLDIHMSCQSHLFKPLSFNLKFTVILNLPHYHRRGDDAPVDEFKLRTTIAKQYMIIECLIPIVLFYSLTLYICYFFKISPHPDFPTHSPPTPRTGIIFNSKSFARFSVVFFFYFFINIRIKYNLQSQNMKFYIIFWLRNCSVFFSTLPKKFYCAFRRFFFASTADTVS